MQAAPAQPARSKKKAAQKRELQPSVDVVQLAPKAKRLAAQLQELFPSPAIPLMHSSHFQLLAAVLLSAQTTDVKVNTVTPELFRRFPTPEAMAKAQASEIEAIIRVLGLAPTKAKNLAALSKMLVDVHGGSVPDTWEGLEALPGVGHKTASVVMAQCFHHPAFPVDTHIHRLAQRWGLTNGMSVEQTEADLKALWPKELWHDSHLQIIYCGRQLCPAVSHDPTQCPICSWAAVPPYNRPGYSPARPGKSPTASAKKAAGAAAAAAGAGAAAGVSAAAAAAPKPKAARRLAVEGGGEAQEQNARGIGAGAPPGKRGRKGSAGGATAAAAAMLGEAGPAAGASGARGKKGGRGSKG